MPAGKVVYYNQIDIGILLCFLDVCLSKQGIDFERSLYKGREGIEDEYTLNAEYRLG